MKDRLGMPRRFYLSDVCRYYLLRANLQQSKPPIPMMIVESPTINPIPDLTGVLVGVGVMMVGVAVARAWVAVWDG